MNAETIDRIRQNSCVAVLPPDTIRQITETGPPLMVFHPQDGGEPVKLAAWGQLNKRWPNRTTLRVRFLGGDSRQRAAAFARMQAIDALCGLAFRLVTGGPSEIRVMFNSGSGHWSYIGTDCQHIPQNQQTMNLELSAADSSKEWDRVALHETLHAVGFNHEHQHPRSVIPWNREAVYKFYGETQGWSRAEIDAQVLNRSTATNIFGTDPDKTSIMMYPIPKELLLDPKFAVGWNSKMSPLDIQTLKRLYA